MGGIKRRNVDLQNEKYALFPLSLTHLVQIWGGEWKNVEHFKMSHESEYKNFIFRTIAKNQWPK